MVVCIVLSTFELHWHQCVASEGVWRRTAVMTKVMDMEYMENKQQSRWTCAPAGRLCHVPSTSRQGLSLRFVDWINTVTWNSLSTYSVYLVVQQLYTFITISSDCDKCVRRACRFRSSVLVCISLALYGGIIIHHHHHHHCTIIISPASPFHFIIPVSSGLCSPSDCYCW